MFRLRLHPRQLEAIWYALPALATRALGFLLLPIYSRVLSPSEFGIVSVALVVSGTLRLVVLPGIEGLYLRYGFSGFVKSGSGRSDNFKTFTRCHLFLLIVVVPILSVPAVELSRRFSPGVPTSLIVMSIAAMAFGSLQAPLMARLKVSQDVARLTAFEVGQLVLSATVTLSALLYFQLGAISLLLGDLVSGILLSVITLREFTSGKSKSGWSREAFRLFTKGFLVVGPEAFLYWGLNAIDRYSLNYFRGPEQTGIYVAAFQFGSIAVALASIGARQWKVIVYRAYVDKTIALVGLRRLYRDSFMLFFSFCAWVAVLSKLLTSIILGGKFQSSHELIPFVMAITTLRVPLLFFSMYAWARQLRRKILVSNALALVVFCLSLAVLVPRYGALGAIWSGGMATSSFVLLAHAWNFDELKFDRTYLGVPFWLSLAGLIFSFFEAGGHVARLALGLALSGVLLVQLKSYFVGLAALEQND